MQEPRVLFTKLQNHSTRFKRLQTQFDNFTAEMHSVIEAASFPVKGLQWERLEANSYAASLAGFTVVLVFNTLVDGDVLKGQIASYRRINFPELQHQHLGDFIFTPDGDTTLRNREGDAVDLVGGCHYIVLDLLHQVIHGADVR